MRIKTVLSRLGLLFGIYTFLRVVFFVFNRHIFQKYLAVDIAHCFLDGSRFDISAILFLNWPFILLSLLVPKKLYNSISYQVALKWIFIATNIPLIIANLADTEYFKFTGNRMTADVFFIQHEAVEQLDQLVLNFWHIVLLVFVCTFVLIKFYPKFKEHSFSLVSWRKSLKTAALSLAVIASLVLGIRGGLQSKPLQPAHAYMSGFAELGVLTLNTTFTLLKSKLATKLSRLHYYPSFDKVFEELKQNKLSYESNLPPQNVVVIILESFATEFWGAANTYPGYTPFLDSLAQEGLFLKNNYANGRRSIDALPAVLFGLPVLMTTPIVRSNYYSNRWEGLASAVKNHNYYTSFFHGAHKGTMYFDVISALAGYDNFISKEKYDGADEYDGNWGIYDEPFLQFMVRQLNKQPQPFLSTVFTISSHQPYHVPPQYEGKFPKGTLKIHASIGYVDYALKQFFEAASKEPWYKNTLFVITGDHTQMSEAEHYNSTLGHHRVPLLFYHPSKKLHIANPDRITQQTDIMPSILDFLGTHNETYLLFGRSVFDETQEGEAIFTSNGSYWLVRDNYYLRFIEAKNASHLYAIDDANQENPITDKEDVRLSMEARVKAYLQLYRNGLIDNKLYQETPQ